MLLLLLFCINLRSASFSSCFLFQLVCSMPIIHFKPVELKKKQPKGIYSVLFFNCNWIIEKFWCYKAMKRRKETEFLLSGIDSWFFFFFMLFYLFFSVPSLRVPYSNGNARSSFFHDWSGSKGYMITLITMQPVSYSLSVRCIG